MTISAERSMDIIRGIATSDARQRESSADEITDIVPSLSRADVNTIAGVVTAAAVVESNFAALESELNALLALCASGFLDIEFLENLNTIDRDSTPGSLLVYINDLLE
ncbi:hypothetical protein D7M15_05915 [Streptomyces sp. Z26]|nr:hypothetical protein D7M15_05915 [Streptomyces sp. Z26]